jgi:hypothetical protein
VGGRVGQVAVEWLGRGRVDRRVLPPAELVQHQLPGDQVAAGRGGHHLADRRADQRVAGI